MKVKNDNLEETKQFIKNSTNINMKHENLNLI